MAITVKAKAIDLSNGLGKLNLWLQDTQINTIESVTKVQESFILILYT